MHNDQFTIREVLPDDIQAWCRMRTKLWPDATDQHLAEIKEFFSANSNHIVQVYIAATTTGHLVGFIELNLRDIVEGASSARVPYVEGWFIDKEYRAAGLGQRLMQQAENWAKALGYNELASDTETDNTDSIDIHKHLGFEETARVVCLLKKLT